MKCKLIRADLDICEKAAIELYGEEFIAANSIPHPSGQKLSGKVIRRWKWGTILDWPGAYKSVRVGTAIPEDDECREATGYTKEQLADAQARYEKLMQDGSYAEEITAKANTPQFIDEDDDE